MYDILGRVSSMVGSMPRWKQYSADGPTVSSGCTGDPK